MIRPLAAIAAASILLSGCAWVNSDGFHTGMPPDAGTALVNLEVLSLVNTRKTLTDHVASWITGQDCSTPRAQREGVFCTDWPGPPPPQQQVYCYASLAKPSCYAQPYNEGNDRLIGFVPAPTPMR